MQFAIKEIFFSGLNKVLRILSVIITIVIWLISITVISGTLNFASNRNESFISTIANSVNIEPNIILFILIILSMPLELVLFGISVIIGKSVDALNRNKYPEMFFLDSDWSLYDFYALMSDIVFILAALPVEICLIINISLWYSLLMYVGIVVVFLLLGAIYNSITVKEPITNENQSSIQEPCSHNCTGCLSNDSCADSPYVGVNSEIYG